MLVLNKGRGQHFIKNNYRNIPRIKNNGKIITN
jgi:hypothetical protein